MNTTSPEKTPAQTKMLELIEEISDHFESLEIAQSAISELIEENAKEAEELGGKAFAELLQQTSQAIRTVNELTDNTAYKSFCKANNLINALNKH